MKQQRRIIVISLVLLIILAQFSFFKPIRDVTRKTLAWPISSIDSIGNSVNSFFSLIGSIGNLSKENAQLKDQNTQLQAQLSTLQTVNNENEQLKKDLLFKQSRSDLKLIPASIINYAPSASFQAVTINKGSNDGVKVEQAVVSSGFLLGKIKNVSASTAEVWLLTNRNILTPVLLTKSQTSGILKGGIRGLVVDTIPVDASVEVGDNVVTSALEGLYPAGIAVGRIEEIISAKEEIFLSARISSPLNVRNIQTVFLVTQ